MQDDEASERELEYNKALQSMALRQTKTNSDIQTIIKRSKVSAEAKTTKDSSAQKYQPYPVSNQWSQAGSCQHCQHVLQLNVEHEIDRLRGEFRQKERDLLENLEQKVN